MSNYHRILGVSEDATPEEIKKAYKRLAAKHHPDKGGDTEEFERIKDAYDHLAGKKTELSPVDDYLMSLFDKFCEVPGDIVKTINRHLNKENDEAVAFIESSRIKLKKLNKRLNRVKAKKGTNLYKLVIENRINLLNHSIQTAEAQLKVVRETLTALDNYTDEGAVVPTPGGTLASALLENLTRDGYVTEPRFKGWE